MQTIIEQIKPYVNQLTETYLKILVLLEKEKGIDIGD